ncbi:MAG: tetratricopeptide repeat protein, partial [bacterium]
MKQPSAIEGKWPVVLAWIRSARQAVLPAVSAFVFMSMAAGSAAEPAPSETLRTGQAALEDGFYELAEKEFLTCLSGATPGTPEAERAAVLLASAYHGRKKYSEILSLLSTVDGAAAAYWRAMAYYELKQYDKVPAALAIFDEQHNGDPYSIHARRLLADSYLRTGRTNDALSVFQKINESNRNAPDSGSASLDWARTLVAAGQTAHAQDVLASLVKRSADTVDGQQGRVLLGRILIASGETDEAEAVLTSLLGQKDADPANKASAMISMAVIQVMRDKTMDATNTLSRAIELAPDRRLKREGEISLGRLLLKMKQPDDGIAILNPYIASVPPDPAAPILQLEVADSLLEGGNADRAVDAYQHYLETFSDKRGKAEAFSGKAWALLLQQKPAYAEAATSFRQAYELFTEPVDKARCLIKAADCHFSNKQFALAAKTYEQVLSEFPDSSLTVQTMFQ